MTNPEIQELFTDTALELARQILDQNNRILSMNEMLMHLLANPMVYIPEDREPT